MIGVTYTLQIRIFGVARWGIPPCPCEVQLLWTNGIPGEDIFRLCNELTATVGAAPTSGCSQVQGEPHAVVQSIITMAEQALSRRQSLLIFGI